MGVCEELPTNPGRPPLTTPVAVIERVVVIGFVGVGTGVSILSVATGIGEGDDPFVDAIL